MMQNSDLQTTARDIRVSENAQPAAVAMHPAQAFVRDLLDRYAARQWRPFMAGMVWLRRQEPAPVSHFQHQTVHLAPRLDLTVLRSEPAEPPRPRLQPSVTGGRLEAFAQAAGPETRRSPGTPGIAATPFVQPVPRVVRPSQIGAAPQPTPAAPTADRDAIHSAKTNAWSVPVPQRVNVNQLTDEIVRTIDRRIVAERERLGKV